jgi:hypothetical protein
LDITSIDVENLRIQPFADDTKEFSDYDDGMFPPKKNNRYVLSAFLLFILEKVCAADIDKNSNVIPIIVGACLAVLVVIVLVAYLIGRRRNRNGYQSV